MESIATISNYLSDNDPGEVQSTLEYLVKATQYTPQMYIGEGEEPVINESYDAEVSGSITSLLQWMSERRESIVVLGLLYQSHYDIQGDPRQARQYRAIKDRFISFFGELMPCQPQSFLFYLLTDTMLTPSFQKQSRTEQQKIINHMGDLITFISEMVSDVLINESLPYEYRHTQSPASSKN